MIWTVLGVALGVAGVFCIVASELLRAFPKLDGWRVVLAGLFAALGAGVWLAGKFRARPRPTPVADEQESISARLGRPFWGAMLVVFAGIVLFIQPLQRSQVTARPPPVLAPTIPIPTNSITMTPVPRATNRPAVFPTLKIQGFILVDGNPVVLIDGETFAVGEQVQGWTVKSVKREGVLMERDGVTKLYKVD